MNETISKARVILSQAVTYLVFAGLLLNILVEELGDFADNPAVGWVIRVAGSAIVVVGVAASIIRRVTTVSVEERGILPKG